MVLYYSRNILENRQKALQNVSSRGSSRIFLFSDHRSNTKSIAKYHEKISGFSRHGEIPKMDQKIPQNNPKKKATCYHFFPLCDCYSNSNKITSAIMIKMSLQNLLKKY